MAAVRACSTSATVYLNYSRISPTSVHFCRISKKNSFWCLRIWLQELLSNIFNTDKGADNQANDTKYDQKEIFGQHDGKTSSTLRVPVC